MPVDPDIVPLLDALEQRFGDRLNITNDRLEALSGTLKALGDVDAATAASLININRRLDSLDAQIAQLETPVSQGGKGGAGIVVAPSNASPAIKAKADVVLTGTGDAAKINLITDPVQLVPGVYLLEQPLLIEGRGGSVVGFDYGTVLMKAATFTNAGRGTTPALIKIADTPAGNETAALQIRDLFLVGRFRANYGKGSPSGSPVAGVWVDITGEGHNDPAVYGYPVGGPDGSDNWSSITRVRVFDTTTGIYVTSTAGARGFEFSDIGISTLQNGGAGLHVAASDARIDRVSTTAGNASNAAGFRIAGGNAQMGHCKAFYFRQPGSVGFDLTSSRTTASLLEAQDNLVGIRMSGTNQQITARIDNQIAGMATGLDLTSASHFKVDGIVQTRSPGTYATGVALADNTTSGLLDLYVDASAITNAVTKAGAPVTASSQLPVNIETRITVRRTNGVGTLRRQLP